MGSTLSNDMVTVTTNYVRYTDHYAKVNGKWYLKKRRTVFIYAESRPAQT